MKATCDAKELAAALRVVKRAVARKSSLPVLGHVLLEVSGDKLTLSATDLAVFVRHSIPCGGEDGAITAPFSALEKVVRLLNGPISLWTEEDKLHIENGGTVTLMGFDQGEFPMTPEITGHDVSITGETLDRLLIAVAQDESRPVLTGVFFENGAVVTADGYRMSIWRSECADKWSALASGSGVKTLRDIAGKGELGLTVSDQGFVYWRDGATEVFVSDPPEGRFPDWTQIEPKHATTNAYITGLNESVKQAFALYGKDVSIFLEVGDGVTVSASDYESSFERELEAVVYGPPVTLAFTSQYLADAVKLFGDEVSLELRDPHSAVLFRDGDFVHVLMPRHDIRQEEGGDDE